ncbi:MAG: hypothetical protein KatS3mg087_0025 [Patescibacteria group bacterium]|nr:MAG: hypothetical protein KatS3mg087_0025 [Patescibacteria group bacterium]
MVIYQRRLRFRGNGCYCKILPVFDEETEALTPFKVNGQNGGWIRVYPSVRLSTAIQPVRFIPYVIGNNISMLSSPIVRLQQAIADARRRNIIIPSWETVFPKSYQSGIDPVIIFDRISYFVLAVVFQLTEEEVYNPPLFPCLLQLPKSAGESLNKITHDILQPDGTLVKFTPRQAHSVVRDGVNTIIPSHYQVDVIPADSVGYVADYNSYIEFVKTNRLSWDKLIQIPPVEEQIQLLAYSNVPKSLMAYTFGNEFATIPNEQYWKDAHQQLEKELAGSSGTPAMKSAYPEQHREDMKYWYEVARPNTPPNVPVNPYAPPVPPVGFPSAAFQQKATFPTPIPQPGAFYGSISTPAPSPMPIPQTTGEQVRIIPPAVPQPESQPHPQSYNVQNQGTPNSPQVQRPSIFNIPGVIPDDSPEDLNPIVSVPAKKVLERLHKNRVESQDENSGS